MLEHDFNLWPAGGSLHLTVKHLSPLSCWGFTALSLITDTKTIIYNWAKNLLLLSLNHTLYFPLWSLSHHLFNFLFFLIYTHFPSRCATLPHIQYHFLFDLRAFVDVSIWNMTTRPHKKASYGPITWAKRTGSLSSCFFYFSRPASIISMCLQRQSDFRPVIVDPVKVSESLYFCPDFHSCQSEFESEQIASLLTTRGHFRLLGHIYVTSPDSASGIIKQAWEVNLFCKSWFI